MLAVTSCPHGFEITLPGAATLSQAHLIQPGRALEAELQVRASFPESLQLHMQLRVAQKSSLPSSCTGPGVTSGSAMIRRRSVVGEVGSLSFAASRVPPSPQVAKPIAWSASMSRVV
jgi:hypothetical protein